jgi:hypothetical protein
MAVGGNFVAGSRIQVYGVKDVEVVTDVSGTLNAVPLSTASVSNPPTQAELVSALGAAASADPPIARLDNGGAGTNVYLCTSDGADWWYAVLTKAT